MAQPAEVYWNKPHLVGKNGLIAVEIRRLRNLSQHGIGWLEKYLFSLTLRLLVETGFPDSYSIWLTCNIGQLQSHVTIRASWQVENMRVTVLIGLFALVVFAWGQSHAPSPPPGDWEHTMWIDGTLTAIESVEVGMSRKDLDKLFTPEGGLHAISQGEVYLYKECPYIKVDVQFTKDGKISRISRPYLAHPTTAKD